MTSNWLNHFNKDVFDINLNICASPQDVPPDSLLNTKLPFEDGLKARQEIKSWNNYHASTCLLYTSDAADD